MWSKAFGSENIIERKAVANKIRNVLALCFKNVLSQLSRERVKQWWQLQVPEVQQLLEILKKTSKPEYFREDEKNFYYEKKKKETPDLLIWVKKLIWIMKKWWKTDRKKTSFEIKKMKKLLSCMKISILKCPIQTLFTLHLNPQ